MEFFNYRNKLKPEKGLILVSEPFLPDPNFERTIILLCEHNHEGSFGFVLNKPSLAKLNDVIEDIKSPETVVFVGGPVQQDTLHYLHRYAELEDAIEVSEGIFWGGNYEQLTRLLETQKINTQDIKFFMGYSGWSPGQLDEEVTAESWIISDQVNEQFVFETDPDIMWKEILKSMGGRFSVYSNYPIDPRLN